MHDGTADFAQYCTHHAVHACVQYARMRGPLTLYRNIPQLHKKTTRAAHGFESSARRKLLIYLIVAREGIEPPTRGFSVRCSTN